MDSCDTRTRAYKNGKTFSQCEEIAESMNVQLKNEIHKKSKLLCINFLEKEDIYELV